MGGFGGALKNISIGIASSHGKTHIHGAGVAENIWSTDHNQFIESRADASESIVSYFKENIVYINVMCNMSVVGILYSTDPVAVDLVCLDRIYASKDPENPHLLERIESRDGGGIQ